MLLMPESPQVLPACMKALASSDKQCGVEMFQIVGGSLKARAPLEKCFMLITTVASHPPIGCLKELAHMSMHSVPLIIEVL